MNYKFTIYTTAHFVAQLKQVTKKYPGFKNDIEKLKSSLLQDPVQGTPLGKNCYKIRIKITGKSAGKSGGARVITFVKLPHLKIVLLDVFDKADKDTVSTNELLILLKKENFDV